MILKGGDLGERESGIVLADTAREIRGPTEQALEEN